MPKFDKVEPVSADTKPANLHVPTTLPKVTITYCTQCRWLLRAAYFAQELLSTFDTALGEVALRPTTGGVFTVVLDQVAAQASGDGVVSAGLDARADGVDIARVLLWDRKAEGGFPETKVLKQRVRDCVQPGRGLGHSDGHETGKDGGATALNGMSSAATGDDSVSQDVTAATSLADETRLTGVRGAGGNGAGRDDCETCP